MSGVTVNITTTLSATLEGVADFGNPSHTVSLSNNLKFNPGTATTAQADLMFADQRSLADGASETLDLAGSLNSVFGTTLSFAEVTAIYFENIGTTNMTIGNAATNTWVGPFGAATHTLTVEPGESINLTSRAGWAVTAGTADLLKVLNGAGAAGAYNIVIIGRSAAV